MTLEAFTPRPKATVQISATTTSANVAFPTTIGDQVLVSAGASDVRIEFGKDSSVVATKVADGAPFSMQVKAGSSQIFGVPANTAYVAAVTDAGASLVEFTPGIGL
ncbi:hypothetical protein [uncultured Methylobacterium sp.]|uniref:hypothetical protein n=1 Tax=uncultured Methylobacterium sp. TaxID=157278 RepID=UPI0035CBADDA